MSHITDNEVDELRHALDLLWGMLEVDQVLTLEKMSPEAVETCKNNHQWVSHT